MLQAIGVAKVLPSFEIRIPACNRPKLLFRALNSLIGQTYSNWKAVVYDDSTSVESRDVVQGVLDDRISYIKNRARMGAAANIDQCFSPDSMFSGQFGCILEDDNYWLPEFLAIISAHIIKGNNDIVLANQRIDEEGVGLRPENMTTRGEWFSKGSVNPLFLRASLLLMEGVSNGGLIWRLGGNTDLRVGPKIKEAGLQEVCRSLLIRAPFLFIPEPFAVWTSIPRSNSARASETNRLFGRGMQSIRSFVLRRHGPVVVEMAFSIAEKLRITEKLIEVVTYCGHPQLARGMLRAGVYTVCKALAKGAAIRLVQGDPCSDFIRCLKDECIMKIGS